MGDDREGLVESLLEELKFVGLLDDAALRDWTGRLMGVPAPLDLLYDAGLDKARVLEAASLALGVPAVTQATLLFGLAQEDAQPSGLPDNAVAFGKAHGAYRVAFADIVEAARWRGDHEVEVVLAPRGAVRAARIALATSLADADDGLEPTLGAHSANDDPPTMQELEAIVAPPPSSSDPAAKTERARASARSSAPTWTDRTVPGASLADRTQRQSELDSPPSSELDSWEGKDD
jgi:hypothetical protein